MVPCPFSVSSPILYDSVSGVLPPSVILGSLGVSVSLCALSLVSLSISLGVLFSVSVSPCLSVSMFLSYVTFFVPVSVCIPDPLCICLCPCLSMSLSPCVPVSLCLLASPQVPSNHLLASLTTSLPWPRRAGFRCCVWGCGHSGRTTTYKIFRTAMARSGWVP